MAEILFSREKVPYNVSKNKLRPSMAVAGKSHIFPGLGYNYNEKKKYFFDSLRENEV